MRYMITFRSKNWESFERFFDSLPEAREFLEENMDAEEHESIELEDLEAEEILEEINFGCGEYKFMMEGEKS